MITAVIDIGSNSVRMLLDGQVSLITTRLAEGLAASGVLADLSMRRTMDALGAFTLAARFLRLAAAGSPEGDPTVGDPAQIPSQPGQYRPGPARPESTMSA